MYCINNILTNSKDELKLISIKNNNNIEIKLLSLGATVIELLVPDNKGKAENIVLTHDSIEDYVCNQPYFGAIIGRTSGRIANGCFILDGKEYNLNRNYGINQGHGGLRGFSFQIWDYEIIEASNMTKVQFSYTSRDMEENYPGNLETRIIYTLTDENELIIEYEAKTDKKTICNLTNHSYFNLSGNYKRKITDQCLRIKSDKFLELDSNLIPTGTFIDVKNTPMDFNEYKLIGRDIEKEFKQLALTNGYDHSWILEEEKEQIEMYDKLSGRKMIVSTTYPCVVVYSYNFPSNEKLKCGKIGSKYDGICFETQYEPDGINNRLLNSAILNPNEKYYEKTVYKFSNC